MDCLNPTCPNALPDGIRSTRKFCSGACRQAYFRMQHQHDQDEALQSEVADLRAKVRDLEQEKADTRELVSTLEQENTRLKMQLDFERRYLEDTGVHGFKGWLKKQPRPSAFAVQFVNDTVVPPRGSRGTYQAHVKRVWPAEMEEFTRLWKLMLLQS